MAVEIHENMKKFLITLLVSSKCTFTYTNGTTGSNAGLYYPTDQYFNGIASSTNFTSNGYFGIVVGSGERSSDASYTIGNVISTVSNYAKSVKNSFDENSGVATLDFFAVGKNTSSGSVTITELGLFVRINGNNTVALLVYEHLDTPIVVDAGGYFTVEMKIEIQT